MGNGSVMLMLLISLQTQYPTINGLKDTVVLAAASKYHSGAKNLIRQVATVLQTSQAEFELRDVDVQCQVGGQIVAYLQ